MLLLTLLLLLELSLVLMLLTVLNLLLLTLLNKLFLVLLPTMEDVKEEMMFYLTSICKKVDYKLPKVILTDNSEDVAIITKLPLLPNFSTLSKLDLKMSLLLKNKLLSNL